VGLGQLPDNSAGVYGRAFVEFHQRSANLKPRTRHSEKLGNPSGMGCGDFHHSLLGLNGHERLISDDMIAFGDMPSHDLGLL
jgi:hypothetical protein